MINQSLLQQYWFLANLGTKLVREFWILAKIYQLLVKYTTAAALWNLPNTSILIITFNKSIQKHRQNLQNFGKG